MIDLIERRRSELEELCRRYHVKTLEVFGSAADGTFDAARSDLDFLVEFLPLGPGQLFDFFFDFRLGFGLNSRRFHLWWGRGL